MNWPKPKRKKISFEEYEEQNGEVPILDKIELLTGEEAVNQSRTIKYLYHKELKTIIAIGRKA